MKWIIAIVVVIVLGWATWTFYLKKKLSNQSNPSDPTQGNSPALQPSPVQSSTGPLSGDNSGDLSGGSQYGPSTGIFEPVKYVQGTATPAISPAAQTTLATLAAASGSNALSGSNSITTLVKATNTTISATKAPVASARPVLIKAQIKKM